MNVFVKEKRYVSPQNVPSRPEREWMCSSSISLTSALDGGVWPTSRPSRLTPEETDSAPTMQNVGLAPRRVWVNVENLA